VGVTPLAVHLVLTWPRSRPLESYLAELREAEARDLVINYRVASRPRVEAGGRCYMAHGGALRGWSEILGIEERGRHEVRDPAGGYWPPGIYVVRSPRWHAIEPVPMRGFQGYRYLPEANLPEAAR
jgi:hypothetical protein